MDRRGFALQIAYLGTGFSGFARQPGRRTVDGVLRAALAQQGIVASLATAARTDAGVHARAQVVSFRVRAELDVAALRAALAPERDLRLLWAGPVGESFHARASAVSRTYVYRLRVGGPPSPFRWVLPEGVYDWQVASEFLVAQLGTRERRPFTYRPLESKETALSEARIDRNGARVLATFQGGGFTRHLIRNWMAAAVALARGEPLPKHGDYGFLGPAAPAEGLCLWGVAYGEGLTDYGPQAFPPLA